MDTDGAWWGMMVHDGYYTCWISSWNAKLMILKSIRRVEALVNQPGINLWWFLMRWSMATYPTCWGPNDGGRCLRWPILGQRNVAPNPGVHRACTKPPRKTGWVQPRGPSGASAWVVSATGSASSNLPFGNRSYGNKKSSLFMGNAGKPAINGGFFIARFAFQRVS